MDAVYVVRSMPHLTLAPPAIQEPIQHRIEKCASQVASSLHRTNVYVPAGVAALLKTYPALVAPAVHAFCQRDASQLQVIRAMRYFPPETRVWTSVTFTKCLYAMLVHRSFQPDKRTGWTLPPVNDAKRLTAELGMKLAVGFELLANEEATHRNAPDCLETDPRWNRFLTSLKTKGFFQDFLEGSQNYNALMEKAREFFVNSRNADEGQVSAKQPVVLRLLESVSIDTEQLKKEESSLPAPDDDSWLSVDPATLEAILEDKFGQMQVDSDKADLMPRLQTFLERSSDFEGVTPAAGTRKKSRKMSHLNPPSRKISTLSNASDMSQMSNKIGFDADSFSSAMQGILDFALPEDNWDLESESSGLSSYSEEDEADDMYSKEMDTYMDAMDQELRTTNVQQTLVDGAIRKESVVSEGGESFSDVENFQPVKIDSTALQSLLASYTLQYGRPGPASTLLAQINLPARDKGASGNDKEKDDMNPM